MLRRFTLLICLVACVAPVAAHGQSSPFAPLPQAAPQQATPTVTATTSSSDAGGGLASWQQVLIFAGGGILLIGIAWAIVSDARSHAPVEELTDTQEAARTRREEDIKRRKAKNRAAAKRSRAARKRNR
ncbi:MAG TPA: hypothetical protein VFG42_21035 [Baekduia sp.]|uniref:hypothetical protein n=1 Tax=Baekduia sp. TaxID=2600305 RepID=UPI002D76804A|nr:hypothetical protein [Baekduia sp.]HET6509295.1 hypothetical protein [Baekduia sp.]